MRRALALLRLEVRTERRYGIHATGVVLAVLWSAVLFALPEQTARFVTPLILFVDTATVGVFLVGAVFLFERGERALAALLASPARVHEYIGAKILSLTALSLAIAVPVAVVGTRGRVVLGPVLLGVALTAVLLLFLALALVARQRTIVGFLTVAPWPLAPLMAVPLIHALGLLDHPLAYTVPTTAAMQLIAAGVTGPPPSLLAVSYSVACAAATGLVAARRFDTAVRAAGG